MKSHRYEKIFSWIIILILLLLLIINYKAIDSYIGDFLKDIVATWGYVGIFIIIFIFETIPQPFISALFAFSAGLLFGLNFYLLLTLTIISAIIANYTAYALGLYYGESLVKIFITKKSYDKSVKWFNRYGKLSITFLALTPLPYFPVLGGIFKMTFKEFTLYAILPRLFHFVIFSFLISFFF